MELVDEFGSDDATAKELQWLATQAHNSGVVLVQAKQVSLSDAYSWVPHVCVCDSSVLQSRC